MSWIDLHCHISMLEQPPEEVIREAKEVGVDQMVTIGTCPEDHQIVFDLAKKFYPTVMCTLGVHPHDAKDYNESVGKFILEGQDHKEVIAVAEIGLDYYYDNSPRDVQKEAFESQLQIALDKDAPVQIHTRDAEEDTVDILKNYEGKIKGTIHCFTGSQWLAEECLKLGLNISFSGIVTFKNAQDLRDVVKIVPLDRLHVETDSPFLTPVPHRGEKNAPKRVIHTAELIADLRNVPIKEFEEKMHENALRTFPKLEFTQ